LIRPDCSTVSPTLILDAVISAPLISRASSRCPVSTTIAEASLAALPPRTTFAYPFTPALVSVYS
jgi:hypothetical protein